MELQEIIKTIVTILYPILAGIGTGIGIAIYKAITAKLKISTRREEMELIREIVQDAVRATEEKVKPSNPVPRNKREEALELARSMLSRIGSNPAETIDDDTLLTLIDATVNKLYHGERREGKDRRESNRPETDIGRKGGEGK